MAKKDFKLVGVAITVGILAIGALYFLNQDEDLNLDLPDTPRSTRKEPTPEAPVVPAEIPQEVPVESTTQIPQPVSAIEIDNVLKEKADKLNAFKNLIKLEVQLPVGMDFVELDLDGNVAAMEGNMPGKKILMMAAERTATPELIASFLKEQRPSIPMFNNYDFKISGPVSSVTPPKQSGISKITIIPGGMNQGNQVYAAYLERQDRKGSYVFVMEASPSQFTQFEGDFDIMVDSLKTKP